MEFFTDWRRPSSRLWRPSAPFSFYWQVLEIKRVALIIHIRIHIRICIRIRIHIRIMSFIRAPHLIFLCIITLEKAGNFALMPPAMVKLYGARRGTLLYGILYSAFAVASIGGMYTSKALTAKFGKDYFHSLHCRFWV